MFDSMRFEPRLGWIPSGGHLLRIPTDNDNAHNQSTTMILKGIRVSDKHITPHL